METKETADIILLVVVGCLGMLILVGFIILFVLYYQKKVLAQQNQIQLAENEYQRKLLKATVSVEEKERERIAKNIHDDIGTLLNVLKMNLGRVSRSLNANETQKAAIDENIGLLDQSIQGIRGIAKDLVPPTLVKLGYIKALKELSRQITNSGEVTVDFPEDAPETYRFDQTEVQLYRLTQELFNNIMRHTGARHITVRMSVEGSRFSLRLIHDGKGITNEQAMDIAKLDRGVGLRSIEGRAQLINAKVTYLAEQDKAAEVRINLL